MFDVVPSIPFCQSLPLENTPQHWLSCLCSFQLFQTKTGRFVSACTFKSVQIFKRSRFNKVCIYIIICDKAFQVGWWWGVKTMGAIYDWGFPKAFPDNFQITSQENAGGYRKGCDTENSSRIRFVGRVRALIGVFCWSTFGFVCGLLSITSGVTSSLAGSACLCRH